MKVINNLFLEHIKNNHCLTLLVLLVKIGTIATYSCKKKKIMLTIFGCFPKNAQWAFFLLLHSHIYKSCDFCTLK
jgi:hypothetical protein